MTDRIPPSRALQALTAAALALPGMAARAADAPSLAVDFSHYSEGKRDLDGQSYKDLNLKPLQVDSFSIQGVIPLTDGLTFKGEFNQDSWSGATPVVTLPAAAVQAQLLSGASSPAFYHIDANGTPYVVDFNDYDPDTDTYGHVAHPGLVHVMASASPETRRQWSGSVTKTWTGAELTVGGGDSDEHDYLSHFVNVGGTFDFNRKLTVLNWGASFTSNRIRASLAANSSADTGNYTDRIHDFDGQPTIFGRRTDIAANAGMTQILNRGALLQMDLSFTRSSGFLENPYKAVMFAFDDPDEPFDNSGLKFIAVKGSLEQRPDVRNQVAANLRFTQHIAATDGALHLGYRFYDDDWGIRAHTFEASLDQPLGGGWTLTPEFRYYSQTAADFYAPYFLFNEVYPAHPGGPLDRSKIPLRYFSSDERLSAFGALSGSVSLEKELGRGLALDLGYERYSHKGSLKLGGGGEANYADFTSSLFTAGLKMDLARRQDEFASAGGLSPRIDPFLSVEPAGLMIPDEIKSGGLVLSAGIASESWGGPVRFGGWPASTDQVIAGGCGDANCMLVPIGASRNALDFALDYSPAARVTLSVRPSYVESSLTLVDAYPSFFGALPPLGGPTGTGRHAVSGLGDTALLATYSLLPAHGPVQIRLAGGVSVPTGSAGRTLNGKSDFVAYSLQPGSGTWGVLSAVAVETGKGPLRAGAQASETARLGTNRYGYRLGNEFRGDLWAGGDIAPWLTVTARLRYDNQGQIKGGYVDHLEHNVPFTELQQVDYDVNGDGVVDSQDVDYVTVYRDAEVPHVVASPADLPGNYGGSALDAGFGLTLRAVSGPFRGDRLSLEWLRPVATRANGYQMRPGTTLSAKASIAL